MSLAPLLLALVAAPSGLGDGFAQFSRSPALHRDRVEVAFGVLGRDRASGGTIYWARRVASGGADAGTAYADSRSCPAMREVLGGLEKLSAPTIAVPGLSTDNNLRIVMDGVGYRLTTTARYGDGVADAEYRSNVGTPLAAWIDDSLVRMQGCWTDKIPQRLNR